jgi:hypothetical protein
VYAGGFVGIRSATFKTRDLTAGKLTVFVQIPLHVLQNTPGLARVIIGALVNSVYEADGQLRGRVLFLLDEAAQPANGSRDHPRSGRGGRPRPNSIATDRG